MKSESLIMFASLLIDKPVPSDDAIPFNELLMIPIDCICIENKKISTTCNYTCNTS